MRKFISLLLALAVVFSLGLTVYAEGTTTPTDESTVNIKVQYKATNEGTTSPAETFKFTIAGYSVKDAADGITPENMPVPTIGDTDYPAFAVGGAQTNPTSTSGEANLKITLSAVATDLTTPGNNTYTSVGVYTYKITPTVPKADKTAGVTYHADPIYLVVTVQNDATGKIRITGVHAEKDWDQTTINGDGKSDTIEEVYSAGKLEVKMFVTGNMADKEKYFDVKVALTGVNGVKYTTIAVSGGSNSSNANTIAIDGSNHTFKIKHGETLTFSNIPYGVTWSVVENDYTTEASGKYNPATYYLDVVNPSETTDWSKETAMIGNTGLIGLSEEVTPKENKDDTVSIVNHKEAEVDTGVILDSAPYILLLAVAVIGLALFLTRKRAKREY